MVIVEDSECAMNPLRTPPLPAHPASLPGAHHVTQNLPFHPALDHRKAAAGIADPKVVHPAAKDRIDLCDHALDRLTYVPPEHLLQLGKQRHALLLLRSQLRSQLPVTSGKIAVLEAKKCEALILPQIDHPCRRAVATTPHPTNKDLSVGTPTRQCVLPHQSDCDQPSCRVEGPDYSRNLAVGHVTNTGHYRVLMYIQTGAMRVQNFLRLSSCAASVEPPWVKSRKRTPGLEKQPLATIRGAQRFRVRLTHGLICTKIRTTSVPIA